MRLSKYFFSIFIFSASLGLLGCSPAMPTPGEFYVSTIKNLSPAEMLGGVLCLKIVNTDKPLAEIRGRMPCFNFALGNIYRLQHAADLPLIATKGLYTYSISVTQGSRATLAIVEKKPLILTLNFQNATQGMYQATYDKTDHFSGTFTYQLRTSHDY